MHSIALACHFLSRTCVLRHRAFGRDRNPAFYIKHGFFRRARGTFTNLLHYWSRLLCHPHTGTLDVGEMAA